MNLNDLKQDNATLNEELVAVRDLMVKEDRKMDEKETKRVDEITRSLADNSANIKMLEDADLAARSLNVVKPVIETKVEKKTNLELVRSLVKEGKQTEEIIERNVELLGNTNTGGLFVERTNYSHTDNGADISTSGVHGLNVLEGETSLWSQMGATVYSDLQGSTQKLPFMDAYLGQLVAEEAGITQDVTGISSVELSPERIGVSIEVTREGLATFNEGTWNGVLQNAYKAIDRSLSALVYTRVLAAATADSGVDALTKAKFDELESNVPVDGIYLMARSTFYKTKAVAIDTGSGLFLANKVGTDMGETYDGTKIFHSGLFSNGAAQEYVVYGVPNNIAIGFWGGDAYELIVDHVTKARTGKIVITISKIVDVKVPNGAKAFFKSADLDPA